MGDTNEEMNKDQPRLSHQQQNVNNSFVLPKELRNVSFHPPKLIIGNPFEGTKSRESLWNTNKHCAFVSHIEPKSLLEAEKDANYILAM